MSKLDNNSKMIVSKYLIGKNFTDFVKTFDLYDYYHTTFNYITINNDITKQSVEKIKKTLQLYPNLNEIVLNFIIYSNIITYSDFLKNVKTCYNKFKQVLQKINIKFNFISQDNKVYKELYIDDFYIYDNIKPFFKNIFIPNVKQKVYINCYFNFDIMLNKEFKDYNIVLIPYKIDINKLQNIINNYKNYKIYIAYDNKFTFKIKAKNINNIEEYFVIKNNIIKGFKPRYNNKIEYIKYFDMYYDLFKFKHINLNYLREYITNADNIINEIYEDNFIFMPPAGLYIIKMYKYGVKNIYIENVIDYNVVDIKLDLTMYFKYINNSIIWLKCKKAHYRLYNDYKELFEDIRSVIKY